MPSSTTLCGFRSCEILFISQGKTNTHTNLLQLLFLRRSRDSFDAIDPRPYVLSEYFMERNQERGRTVQLLQGGSSDYEKVWASLLMPRHLLDIARIPSHRFWFSLLVSFILLAGIVVVSTPLVPYQWRIDGSGWAVIFPIAYVYFTYIAGKTLTFAPYSVMAGCHILFPVSAHEGFQSLSCSNPLLRRSC